MHSSSHSGSLQAERASTNQGCLAEHEVHDSTAFGTSILAPLVFSMAGDPESEAAAHQESLQRASAVDAEAASIGPRCQHVPTQSEGMVSNGCLAKKPVESGPYMQARGARRAAGEESFRGKSFSHHFDRHW